MPPDLRALEPAARERSGAPVSADSAGAAIAADRPHDSTPAPARRPRTGCARSAAIRSGSRSSAPPGTSARSWSGCSPATPTSSIVGLVGRERQGDPIGRDPPPPRHERPAGLRRRPRERRGRVPRAAPRRRGRPDRRVPRRAARPSSTSGPTSACATPPTTRAGTTSTTRGPTCSRPPSTACPSCTATSSPRPADAPSAIVGAPGCYATTTILALAPLARAGLIGDLVVDAKSGVSGRRPRPEGRTCSSARSTRASRRTGSSPIATSARSSRSSGALGGGRRRTRA